MQDITTWDMISKHLSQKESEKDKEIFFEWFNENENNKELFSKIKAVWDGETIDASPVQNKPTTFLGRFTKEKMKQFVLKQAIGNLVGFIVGMWVTASFSHYVLERRTLKNLFGLNGRKRIAVNEIPEWMQSGIAILVGFIALELINHFFQSGKHLLLWDYLKRTYSSMKKQVRA